MSEISGIRVGGEFRALRVGGQMCLIRAAATGDPGDPGDPGEPEEPGVVTVAEGSRLILSDESPVLAPGVTLTVLQGPQYLLDGVPFVPASRTREWMSGQTVLATGNSYVTQAGVSFSVRETIPHPVTGQTVILSPEVRTQVYTVQSDPTAAPPAPDAADWAVLRSEYNSGSTTDFKPILTFSGALVAAGVEIQWTTSFSVPALPEHWEPLIDLGGGEWTTGHKDGPDAEFASFTAAQATRRENQFRLRYRISGGLWSPEGTTKVVPLPPALVMPAAVTGFTAVPGSGDGEVVIGIGAQSSWGDGTPGTIRLSSVPTGDIPLAAGTLTLTSGYFGKNVAFQAYAKSAEGYEGPRTTITVAVPGTATTTGLAARYHFISTAALDSWKGAGSIAAPTGPDNFRYGKSGVAHQFCYMGGLNSDGSKASFIMDVGPPWIGTNWETDWPQWRLCRALGLKSALSVSFHWHPTQPNTFAYVAGATTADGPNQERGSGVYKSTDGGATMTHVLRVVYPGETWNPNLLKSFVKGGSIEGQKYRNSMQIIKPVPGSPGHWFFFQSDGSVHKSEDDLETLPWVSDAPKNNNVGRIAAIHPLDDDTIWVGADTGLWRSTTGGAGLTKTSPQGLPAGRISFMEFNPDDPTECYVVVYGKGMYRATNMDAASTGAIVFTRVGSASDTCYMGIQWRVGGVPRPVASRHMWCFLRGQGAGTIYSSNGGANWSPVVGSHNTYGWNEQNKFYTNPHANANSDQNQVGIIPSLATAGHGVATSACTMWKIKGTNWVNSSDFYSNRAGGEGRGFYSQRGNKVACMIFDSRMTVSEDGGYSWRDANTVAPGVNKDYNGWACDIHPLNTDRVITTGGFYTWNPASVVISTDFCTNSANSFRPNWFVNTFGAKDRTAWAAWHGQELNTAYCQHGISFDAANKAGTWQTWVQRETSGNTYATEIGAPALGGDGDVYDKKGVWGRSEVNGNRLFACRDNKLLETTNKGTSWRVITLTQGPSEFGWHYYSLCPHPTDEKEVYWWDAGTGLRRWREGATVGGGGTISLGTGSTALKDLNVQVVCIDPVDPDVIYLMNREPSSRNSPRAGIWRTTGGFNGTFTDISANLPDTVSNKSMTIRPDGVLLVLGVVGGYMFGPPRANAFFDHVMQFHGPAS